MTLDNIKIIAHRGEGPTSLIGKKFPTKVAPENSITALDKAFKSQADGIKLDVFLSENKEVMVIHDNELWSNVYNVNRNLKYYPKLKRYIISQENYEGLPDDIQKLIKEDNEISNLPKFGIQKGYIIYQENYERLPDDIQKSIKEDNEILNLPKVGIQKSYRISQENYEVLPDDIQKSIREDNEIWDKFHNTYLDSDNNLDHNDLTQYFRISESTYSMIKHKKPEDFVLKTVKNSYPTSDAILSETQESFRIEHKTYEELKNLHIGPNGNIIPRLEEFLFLISEHNQKNERGKNFIINIELKDKDAAGRTLEVCSRYVDGSKIKWNDIIFCSFNHDCLKEMIKNNKTTPVANPLQVAPSIKTTILFGEDNVDKKTFTVKEGTQYSEEGLEYLKNLVKDNEWVAYDAVVWDIKRDFIKLIVQENEKNKNNKKSLHLSTSNYRLFSDKRLFDFLTEASEDLTVFIKTDEPKSMREMLERHKLKKSIDKNTVEENELLKKTGAFSKILKKGWRRLEQQREINDNVFQTNQEALVRAIVNNNIEEVKKLLKANENLLTKDNIGNALKGTGKNGHTEIGLFILDQVASIIKDPYLYSYYHDCLLNGATKKGKEEMIKELKLKRNWVSTTSSNHLKSRGKG